jgi:hypothetical protein
MPTERISQLPSAIFDVSQNIAASVSISHFSEPGWTMRQNGGRNLRMQLHVSAPQSVLSKPSSLMSPRCWISRLQRLAMKEFTSQVRFWGRIGGISRSWLGYSKMSSWNSAVDGWIHLRNGWDSKNGSTMVNPGLPIRNWLPKSANMFVNCFKSLGMNGGTCSIWMRQPFFMREF